MSDASIISGQANYPSAQFAARSKMVSELGFVPHRIVQRTRGSAQRSLRRGPSRAIYIKPRRAQSALRTSFPTTVPGYDTKIAEIAA